MSEATDRDASSVADADGKARLGVIVAVIVLLGGAGVAAMMWSGDEEADSSVDEAVDESFDEAYTGGDEVADEAGDEEPDSDAAQEVADEDFDPESWDGQFRTLSDQEIETALHRALEEYDPDDYGDAIQDVEMAMRKSINDLEPEARREYALNFDRARTTRVLMSALREHVSEEEYQATAEQMDTWQGPGWREE